MNNYLFRHQTVTTAVLLALGGAALAQLSSATPVFSPGLPRAFFVGLEAKW